MKDDALLFHCAGWNTFLSKPRAKHRGGPRHMLVYNSDSHTPESPAPWRRENSTETKDLVFDAAHKRSGTWAPWDSGWILYG